MNYDNLKEMELPALRTLAIQQGMTPHHRSKKETLIRQIIEHVKQPPVKAEMKHPAESAQEAPKKNTQEEILAAIKPFIEKKEDFQAIFTADTWHFKYKGCEDCGNLSIPLRVIKMKAHSVSHGARSPRKMKFDGDTILSA